MGPAAAELASFACGLALEDLPAEVVDAAKLHLLDTLGCALAAHALGVGGEGRAYAVEAGGSGRSSVVGHPVGLPAPDAALANGMLGHALDFDDTHSASFSHVSVVVGPAAVALAEARATSGADLVCALVAGSEVAARVGMAAGSGFHARGFHPTSVCGVFGATAAAVRLEGLAPATATSAFGIAGSMASGLFAYLEDGTATKPIHPAWAARGALVAARLAAHGAEGPPHVLDGRFGLYDAFLGRRDLAPDVSDLGSRWETARIAYKPFPACHYVHAPLSAASEAIGERRFGADDLEDVLAIVPEPAVSLVCEPAAAKVAPRNDYEAKFSLQYSLAAMLVHGEVGVATYRPEALADESVLAVARKVRFETREFPSFPKGLPGAVRIRTAGGEVLEAELPYQRGGPENPLGRDEVLAKYRANAALALPDAAVAALEDALLALEEPQSVEGVFAPLASA